MTGQKTIIIIIIIIDRLCGLVIRVPDYCSRGPRSILGVLRSSGSGTGLLSLVSTTEQLLGRNSSGSGLENREYGSTGSAALTTRHPSIRNKLALTWPTSGDRSVGIVRSRTQATEFICFYYYYYPTAVVGPLLLFQFPDNTHNR
jgi:hypothetical protein